MPLRPQDQAQDRRHAEITAPKSPQPALYIRAKRAGGDSGPPAAQTFSALAGGQILSPGYSNLPSGFPRVLDLGQSKRKKVLPPTQSARPIGPAPTLSSYTRRSCISCSTSSQAGARQRSAGDQDCQTSTPHAAGITRRPTAIRASEAGCVQRGEQHIGRYAQIADQQLSIQSNERRAMTIRSIVMV
jgi:hypothetical protein